MENIKVPGAVCANCKTTIKLIEDAAKEKGAEIGLGKVEGIQAILSYGVMSTAGVPCRDKIAGWL